MHCGLWLSTLCLVWDTILSRISAALPLLPLLWLLLSVFGKLACFSKDLSRLGEVSQRFPAEIPLKIAESVLKQLIYLTIIDNSQSYNSSVRLVLWQCQFQKVKRIKAAKSSWPSTADLTESTVLASAPICSVILCLWRTKPGFVTFYNIRPGNGACRVSTLTTLESAQGRQDLWQSLSFNSHFPGEPGLAGV